MMRSIGRGSARPEVTMGNYAAVYDYFGPARRRRRFAHALFRLIAAVWAPEVRLPAAVEAEVGRFHDSGVGTILVANHPSHHDPFVMTGIAWDRRLRFLSRCIALVKDELLRGPIAPLFEFTGTLPVFRAKDYPNLPREVHAAAADRLLTACADHVAGGGSVIAFVEGTTSAPEDLRALRPESVKRGIGEIVHAVRETGRPVAVLPMGLAYAGREHARLPRHVVAAAGDMIIWDDRTPVPTVDEVRASAREGINGALEKARRDRAARRD